MIMDNVQPEGRVISQNRWRTCTLTDLSLVMSWYGIVGIYLSAKKLDRVTVTSCKVL